ncbi:hypothetical protein BGZ96_002140 [Linnemannia gamsii]|uniref:Uncharacterized protein n=1 Tax=Linnemannia gamsii TaxID=64522 RepID=A0ABQ7JL15_9FUNG|nr:hypothetical protein BGZ96_002140 [Linnemannia gamsii]
MLVQTNRRLRDIAAPLLWRNIDLEADERVEKFYRHGGKELLLTDSDCIKINQIRSLKAGFAFMSYYLDGVRQFLDKDSTQQQDMPPSEWIPKQHVNLYSTPLPLIKRLERLDVSLLRTSRLADSFFVGLNSAPPIAPRLIQFMALNAEHLTSVSLQHFSITKLIDFRHLCWTINTLTVLVHLAIDIPIKGDGRLLEHPFSIITALFFSCPSSLVSFSMTTTVRDDNSEEKEEGYFLLPQEPSDTVAEAKPTPRTQEPFKKLKCLKLPQHKTGYSPEQLNRIMKQCPALEEWVNVPSSLNLSGESSLAGGDRLEYPSTLLDLSTRPVKNCKGKVVAGIMKTIKENQLKFLDFRLFEDTPPNSHDPRSPFVGSLLRHANSLVSISLVDIKWIQSKSIKFILTTCAALRTLVFASSNTMQSCLALEDATTEPWACTGIRELRLIVNLNCGCADRYSRLDKLYTQIGALEYLETLDLKSACRHSRNASKPYTETTMTCMLALRNETTSRQGFLQSLAKLKNLRVLLGSLLLDNQEMYSMLEDAEVNWILENWPCLETIELISDRVRRLGPAHWPHQTELLKRGRSNLEFWRTWTK